MTSTSTLKNHHISILYYWNKGIRSAPLIHRETNIPLRTIYYNIDKLKQTSSLKHRGGNGRSRVLSGIEKKATAQYIRRNNEINLSEIKDNLWKMYHKSVSTSTISRHLHQYGYKNVLPQSTHILTKRAPI
jgi:transposase